jgi:hypothetical protein
MRDANASFTVLPLEELHCAEKAITHQLVKGSCGLLLEDGRDRLDDAVISAATAKVAAHSLPNFIVVQRYR